MHLFLRLLGNDEPVVARAVAVLATLTATRRALAHHAFMALVTATIAVNLLAAAVMLGGGQ
ncbi:MAG: hypothetical protein ACK4PC_03545 [Sphingopyxis sp.]